MREKSAKIRFLRIYIECTISAVLWACLALQKTDGEGGRGRVRESGSRVKRRLKKKKKERGQSQQILLFAILQLLCEHEYY